MVMIASSVILSPGGKRSKQAVMYMPSVLVSLSPGKLSYTTEGSLMFPYVSWFLAVLGLNLAPGQFRFLK